MQPRFQLGPGAAFERLESIIGIALFFAEEDVEAVAFVFGTVDLQARQADGQGDITFPVADTDDELVDDTAVQVHLFFGDQGQSDAEDVVTVAGEDFLWFPLIVEARGVAFAAALQFVSEKCRGHALEHILAQHLLLEEGDAGDGQWLECFFDENKIAALRFDPAAEIGILQFLGEDAIADNGIDGVAIEVEVGEGALGLLNDHFFGVDHQAHTADAAVAEEEACTFEDIHQIFDAFEEVVVRQWDIAHTGHDGPCDLECAAFKGHDLLDIPAGDIGKAEQLQGGTGGRGVDDNGVVGAAVGQMCDVHEAGELFHAGQDGSLFGDQGIHAAPGEEYIQIFLHAPPVFVHLMQQVDLLAPEVGRQFHQFTADAGVKAVAEAVGGIGAEDDGSVAEFGAAQCAGRADTGFADSAFPGIEKNSHQSHSVDSLMSGRCIFWLVLYKKVRRAAGMVPEGVRNLWRPVRRVGGAESVVAVAVSVLQMALVNTLTKSWVKSSRSAAGETSLVVILSARLCPGIIIGVLFALCGEDVGESCENPETVFEL